MAPPRILIITAAFGEGHNSAARNMALALEELGAEARVADPCMLGAPVSTRWMCLAYRLVTTYAPSLWRRIYFQTAAVDFSKQTLPLMRKPERMLGDLLESFQPDAVVSTYPLYPYFLDRLLEGKARRPAVHTVVTDSIEINAAWLKAPTDSWLVTEPLTADAMVRAGAPAEKVIDTGFPVNPCFSRLEPLPADAAAAPFKVLFFATANVVQLKRISLAVLESPQTRLTLALGKNLRLLYRTARELSKTHPGRVKIKGWTRKVPQMLNRHHLVIGKAGGATVHEAIAARCPMLVHHLVPGQEEGNLRLLEKIGGGMPANSSSAVRGAMTDLLADGAAKWRMMKRKLAAHGRNAGAISAANYVLEKISEQRARQGES